MHHNFKLNGHTIYVRRMDPFLALGVLADLQQILLSPVLKGASGHDLGSQAKILEALVAGFEGVSSSLGRAQTVALAKMLIDPEFVSVEIDGAGEPQKLRETIAPVVMKGASDILTICVEVVKVNYSSFLEVLAPLISSASSLVESQSGSFPKN